MIRLRHFLTVILLGILPFLSFAHEGMWVPSTLAKLVIDDMHDAGLKLTADEIYSINQSSLKDAIVLFGGGCTAEVISDQGLILTNHHCGYSQIQSHSSLENDYLKEGFWAMDRSEELNNPGLTATFVVRIEDVTESVMSAGEGLEGQERAVAMNSEAERLMAEAVEGTGYDAEIKPFFYGNAYYMIVTETFKDVRLVGAPPSSIGKFGGDTDNWEWPRHTGDFSLFRIYASPDNSPADYAEENVPYRPKASLEVNMNGVRPGDFTMVFGFPGSTYQYLTSYAVDYILNVQNPSRIEMREASLGVIDAAMESSDEIRIKYAAKQSRISNAYKKWIGQNLGLNRFDALEKKREHEERFKAALKESWEYEEFGNLLENLEKIYQENQPYVLARDYLIEYYYYGPELIRFALRFKNLVENFETLETEGKFSDELKELRSSAESFYKDYDRGVDRSVFAAQTPIFISGAPELLIESTLQGYFENSNGDGGKMADKIYKESVFDELDELGSVLGKSPKKIAKVLSEDPFYKIAEELMTNYDSNAREPYAKFKAEESASMKEYLRLWMKLFPDEDYWPDANSTLRLTYGKMEGSKPNDGVLYDPYTTLDGVMAKYIPGDKEFDVPEKLIELHADGDYGAYATNGEMRVCFLGSNHTTGGNSGSPALDANGRLVGLNFDRTWESTMSDVMFNAQICRNIMVDIKYVLFIVDKFAGARHLIDEMSLVYPEENKKAVETSHKVEIERKSE